MSAYDHASIEPKWQKRWAEQGVYKTKDSVAGKNNFYTLVEFPYPSGDLHIGHWYAYSVPDVFARMKRMQGMNVLFPFGFDAFGLPAENAAIKHDISPKEWTEKNIEKMRVQMHSMGNSFDWDREVITCHPEYYRWTQWLFLQLFKKGLAYRGKALVNWDPVDQTVLANEQVLPDGTAERSGAKVEKKELAQWFLKITDYADRLIDDLDALNWPEPIKDAQRNWIGRSEGATIGFKIQDSRFKKEAGEIEVFTTRPDTLFGATYLVLAPEHPLIPELLEHIANKKEALQYIEVSTRKSELERQENKEKTGVELKGVKAVNPATKEKIPVFIADYVLSGYGTGAIMAVPAHDGRDFEFAKKFDLPIRKVILPPSALSIVRNAEDIAAGAQEDIRLVADCWSGEGMLANSGSFNGLSSEEAKNKITESVGGRMVTRYRFRDWLISRQRYWGAPIPIVYDPEGQPHPVPEKYLPWLLPEDADIKPKGTSPLGSSKELKERTEKLFGKWWTPETDTMDGFVDNSWYFLRYLDPKNSKEFSSLEKQKAWMPIARYSGGAEHTTVHVLYSRFFCKALYDMGLATEKEPYRERLNRGIILAEDGRKMSKRWGNVVNPDDEVKRVGADAVRTYLAFIGPYNEVGSFPWSTNGLVGVRRFLERVYELRKNISTTTLPPASERVLHQTIKKVGEDIESMKFNTAVSSLMILSNELGKQTSVPRSAYETLLVLLAPFAPHLAEEVWAELGHKESIHIEKWPIFNSDKLVGGKVTIAVQINGKTKGTVITEPGSNEGDVVACVRADAKLSKVIPLEPKKVIFVTGRIINFLT